MTGLEIFKLLPRTNCKECGNPTCLAFAMALANAKITLDKCPHASEDCKAALGGAAAPPVKLVKLGVGTKAREIGDEVVLFRHDKAFYHPTAYAVEINDNDADFDAKLAKINDLKFERVGQKVSIDLIAVRNASKSADTFAKAAEVATQKGDFSLVLMSDCTEAMEKALEVAAIGKPLVYAATETNWETMANLAKKYACPLAVCGKGLENIASLVEKVAKVYGELVIDAGNRELSQAIAEMTQMRRLAIKKKFKPFGYPIIAFTNSDDPQYEVIQASGLAAKYASIIVLKACEKSLILPLMAWRMNLYTDPQKPSQVEPGMHAIGAATADSPVYCTTNFSLTYYTVEGEISASKIPSWIIAAPTDGTSVLTSYAAGKFTGEKVAEFMQKIDAAGKVNHKNIVIPGYVAVMKGILEEKSGWNVMIAPREASGLRAFAKANFLK